MSPTRGAHEAARALPELPPAVGGMPHDLRAIQDFQIRAGKLPAGSKEGPTDRTGSDRDKNTQHNQHKETRRGAPERIIMAESTSIYCTERGYMEIPVDVYTGLVERSERLAVYEELMRGYNPVTLILAGKKQIRKKRRKEERKERAQIQAELNQENGVPVISAYRAGYQTPGHRTCHGPYTCPDPDKLMALINAGFTAYRLADEFKTDVETVDLWISRLDAGAEDEPGEAEIKPAEEKPADPTPAEEAHAADPATGQDAPESFQVYSGPVTEKKRPGRPRAKIRKDVNV